MLSEAKVIALYCITDDLLKAFSHTEDRRVRVCDAEVIPNAFGSALYFPGHQENARLFMQQYGQVPTMRFRPAASTAGCTGPARCPARSSIRWATT